MNITTQSIRAILLFGLLIPTGSNAANIFKADAHFTAKNYKLAEEAYLNAAKIGNPHALYQLGSMYHKGLGVEKDTLNALIYIARAADLGLEPAETALSKMLAGFNQDQRLAVKKILERDSNYKNSIERKYYPLVNQTAIKRNITFEGQNQLSNQYFSDDLIEDIDEYALDDFSEDEFYSPMTSTKEPFLIIDHDVATDGSVRNITIVQEFGFSQTLLKAYSLFPLPKPSFESQAVEFAHRVSLGSAVFNKFTLIEKNEALYSSIFRHYKKLKKGTSLNDRYLLTMALQNFPWLDNEETDLAANFLELAKQGHPGAMFEYGYLLLRKQENIPEAVKWIGLASSYGLARAEYRLGKLLTTSPWVELDEQKALFWFESAAQKDHVAAALKAAELKLQTTNKSILDIDGAVNLLKQIADKQQSNPEYFYVLALSHRYRENRDFTQVVKNLEKAILMGSNINWDVSEWQNLLSTLTEGKVYITE